MAIRQAERGLRSTLQRFELNNISSGEGVGVLRLGTGWSTSLTALTMQTLVENVLHVSISMKNSHHLQRSRFRSVNDQIGVNRKELHRRVG
jgi:hypothetical protein